MNDDIVPTPNAVKTIEEAEKRLKNIDMDKIRLNNKRASLMRSFALEKLRKDEKPL